MEKLSERRLKENEVIFQQANKGVADFVLEDEGDTDRLIDFYCECSNIDCRMRIPLSASNYFRLHKSQRHFIALDGHQTPEIEKVIAKKAGFIVVEKEGEIPSIKDINKTIHELAQEV